jgi:hypothetical protein
MLVKIPAGRRYSELPKGFTTFRHEDGRKPRSDAPANDRTTWVRGSGKAGPPAEGDYRATEHGLRGPARDVMGDVRAAVAVGTIGFGPGAWRR